MESEWRLIPRAKTEALPLTSVGSASSGNAAMYALRFSALSFAMSVANGSRVSRVERHVGTLQRQVESGLEYLAALSKRQHRQETMAQHLAESLTTVQREQQVLRSTLDTYDARLTAHDTVVAAHAQQLDALSAARLRLDIFTDLLTAGLALLAAQWAAAPVSLLLWPVSLLSQGSKPSELLRHRVVVLTRLAAFAYAAALLRRAFGPNGLGLHSGLGGPATYARSLVAYCQAHVASHLLWPQQLRPRMF
jgi:hypothetical protein